MDKNIIENTIDFVKQKYPNHHGCMITGSYAVGKNNDYSDIDILIFTNDRNTFFYDTLPFNGFKMQAFVIPIQHIEDVFWSEYFHADGSIITMICMGKILLDSSDYLKDLVSHAKELKALGGRALTEREILMKRAKITSIVHDLMGGLAIEDLMFSITELLDLLTETKLRIDGNWCSGGKHRMRNIKNLYPDFHKNLKLSVTEIYGLKNRKPLIALATEFLNMNGGFLPYYSNADTLTEVVDDFLVIEIANNIDKEIVKKTIETFNSCIDGLAFNDIKYYYFLHNPLGSNVEDHNIFLVIEADKKVINEYLIAKIDLLKDREEVISKFDLCVQLDVVYRFSTKKIYYQVSPLFFEVSDKAIKNGEEIFDPSFQLDFSLRLMRAIKRIWFSDNSAEFVLFLDYLMACWLAFSYDIGSSQRVNDLFRRKQIALEDFEYMYEEQKLDLIEIYNSNELLEKEIIKLLEDLKMIEGIESVPEFKQHLIKPALTNTYSKKLISIYREVISKLLSIILLDNRLFYYIPYTVKRIELEN